MAILALLLAGPAGALFHAMEAEPGAGPAADAGYDPLLLPQSLYATPGGTLSPEPPAEGNVPAPMALPPAESTVLWAREVQRDFSIEGRAVFMFSARANLPAAAVPPRALFRVDLLKGGDAVASAEVGPAVMPPASGLAGPVELAADGTGFAAGDVLAIAVTFRSLSPGPAPAVEYGVGPNGSRLEFLARLPGLDALDHAHAPGDRHFLASEYRFREGDLGDGLWGLKMAIWGARAEPASVQVPEGKRALLQLVLDRRLAQDDPPPGHAQGLDLPGGATTLYEGEVLVREVSLQSSADVACTTCGAGRLSIASVQAAEPAEGNASREEPVSPTRQAQRVAGSYDEVWWVLALFLPVGIMLGAAMLYVMRSDGPWGSKGERSAPPRPQQRGAQPRGQQRPLPTGNPARRP